MEGRGGERGDSPPRNPVGGMGEGRRPGALKWRVLQRGSAAIRLMGSSRSYRSPGARSLHAGSTRTQVGIRMSSRRGWPRTPARCSRLRHTVAALRRRRPTPVRTMRPLGNNRSRRAVGRHTLALEDNSSDPSRTVGCRPCSVHWAGNIAPCRAASPCHNLRPRRSMQARRFAVCPDRPRPADNSRSRSVRSRRRR